MIRVAIVEDDINEANNLNKAILLYKQESGEDIIISNFDSAEGLLTGYKPQYDAIFMDIELPVMSGMDAAAAIRKLDDSVIIIFVTNMIKYAVHGYKVGALDYFLKPVSYYDLRLRMEQVRMSIEDKTPVIAIPLADGIKSILSSKVYYIEIMNHQLTYHTVDGEYSVSSNVSLSKLEKQYNEYGFVRCSSSYLVNLDWCSEFRSESVKVGNDTLKISRGMKKSFTATLSKRLIKKW